MKTIRQIADEIGVSKQAVYKRYKGKLHTVCAPYAHTEQGVLYLSEQAETLIKQDFLKVDRSIGAHTDTHTERSSGAVSEQSQEDSVVAVLQATIDTLQGQLEVKDRQIEKLTEALVAAQKTAAAAQALHAGTIQQQLLTDEAGADQQGQEPEPGEKRGWFRKLVADRKQKGAFMKKLISFLLALCLSVSLAACEGKSDIDFNAFDVAGVVEITYIEIYPVCDAEGLRTECEKVLTSMQESDDIVLSFVVDCSMLIEENGLGQYDHLVMVNLAWIDKYDDMSTLQAVSLADISAELREFLEVQLPVWIVAVSVLPAGIRLYEYKG